MTTPYTPNQLQLHPISLEYILLILVESEQAVQHVPESKHISYKRFRNIINNG